ncbi:polyamine ABC transporter ATP-binding protein [Microvirga sp. KLBC 81]|uniref:ABC transporter ATP-binding protein n=1 Tax=Microvirga sp. KLBC 81 TaxID=1862707 RepID=UPI000D50C2C4|nr:ABC transporter ATP-binding protein [Microvirga sp. KLBC 81]PVE25640.1 polyamine ABC transporter ATP-binding protein [Microvirga sp. KLBC 81]
MAKPKGVGVSIKSATKTYGSFRALDNVSLDISPGEFVSILGPSGSGKTTFLGILGGFVQPSSGAIFLGDEDITFSPPHKREIGIVFQNYALFPHMSVGENVAFPLRARRIPKAEWPDKVRDALAMVELQGFEKRRISELSGGQRQRVALARAIIFEPRLILMDEPLSALDKQLRESMQIELRHLHRKLGSTIIYVTHDQREALTMSDRVAVMNKGKIVQIDTPERLHDWPVDSFVASFIGEATLVPVDKVGPGKVRIGKIALRSDHAIPAAGEAFLAVQSEKLIIVDGEAPDGMNYLAGTVTEVLFQGESIRVFLELENGKTLSVRQACNHTSRQKIKPVGAPMTVALHPQDTIIVPRT